MKRSARPDLRPVRDKTLDELEGYAPSTAGSAAPNRVVLAARAVPVGELAPRQALVLFEHRQGVLTTDVIDAVTTGPLSFALALEP